MYLGKAVFEEEGIMKLCTIPLVNWERIGRISEAQTAHQAVAADFGDNGSAGNKNIFFITFYNCLLIFKFFRRLKQSVQSNETTRVILVG